MPTVLLTAASGGPWPLISGNFFSGQAPPVVGGIQLVLFPNASGNAYVSLSGGATVSSGGFFLSGINTTDAMVLSPGGAYFIPRSALYPSSGTLNVFVTCDPACSGQARMAYERL